MVIVLKQILVPLGRSTRDLKSVHYALALAERLEAKVSILQQVSEGDHENPRSHSLDETLSDLINTARQAGIKVAHLVTSGDMKDEIIEMARVEEIDVVVLGKEDGIWRGLQLQIKSLLNKKIIRVKEKNHISYM